MKTYVWITAVLFLFRCRERWFGPLGRARPLQCEYFDCATNFRYTSTLTQKMPEECNRDYNQSVFDIFHICIFRQLAWLCITSMESQDFPCHIHSHHPLAPSTSFAFSKPQRTCSLKSNRVTHHNDKIPSKPACNYYHPLVIARRLSISLPSQHSFHSTPIIRIQHHYFIERTDDGIKTERLLPEKPSNLSRLLCRNERARNSLWIKCPVGISCQIRFGDTHTTHTANALVLSAKHITWLLSHLYWGLVCIGLNQVYNSILSSVQRVALILLSFFTITQPDHCVEPCRGKKLSSCVFESITMLRWPYVTNRLIIFFPFIMVSIQRRYSWQRKVSAMCNQHANIPVSDCISRWWAVNRVSVWYAYAAVGCENVDARARTRAHLLHQF